MSCLSGLVTSVASLISGIVSAIAEYDDLMNTDEFGSMHLVTDEATFVVEANID
ncbi:uncharacterized protein BYT42DRAFT_610034 [Radiomyces spectabilis]|uniref:uncharacterized protein n=1 Tax=Radiomyces spectabilis TaxID=64574 RepID=UPI00221F8532|nr:uncharacterized protein BYT42DRAFT_610034 [Radiomyces spectabilis]KAI8394310.1 hypothetical protein BYT42DRAFT_610034 [Radiomyces spectabilis]